MPYVCPAFFFCSLYTEFLSLLVCGSRHLVLHLPTEPRHAAWRRGVAGVPSGAVVVPVVMVVLVTALGFDIGSAGTFV